MLYCSIALRISRKFSENTESGIILHLPLSREGMANSLGIARETSAELGQFESKGIIHLE
jgi:CRP/FNR family transcriptional regulator